MAGNYLQFDPRLPRAQAPRGLAPMNMVKAAGAGNATGQRLSAIPASYRAPVAQGSGLSALPAGYGPMNRPPVDFGSLNLRPLTGGIAADQHGPLSQHQFGGLVANAVNNHPLGTDYRPDGTPVLNLPPRPPVTGVMPQGGPMAGQPYTQYDAVARPLSAIPAGYPKPPESGIPFTGSPVARQGIAYFPSTPIGQMTPFEARAQVPSMYGNNVATHGPLAGQGTANGYVSSPMARVPLNQVLSPTERGMLNRDSNAGAFGTLGGSAGRTGAMAALVPQQAQGVAPAPVDHPWNPALMAQVQQQVNDRNDPRNIAERRAAEIRMTPEYQANRARSQAYAQQVAQRLAANRRDNALANGIAMRKQFGIPLSPAQNDFLARGRQAQAGNYAGPNGVGYGFVGTGLNAPPRPFAGLNPAPQVTEMDPDREQRLLGLLNMINEHTPDSMIDSLRSQVQPGEMEYLATKHQPRGTEHFDSNLQGNEKRRLMESIDRVRQGRNYRTPAQRAEDMAYAYGAM